MFKVNPIDLLRQLKEWLLSYVFAKQEVDRLKKELKVKGQVHWDNWILGGNDDDYSYS
tara:strand:- start:1612 stop:1785 length:174 start_codon:yes stop_codon:yes gene_type:complete